MARRAPSAPPQPTSPVDAPDPGAAVRWDGAAKTYGDVRALHPLDLEVAPGEFLVLVGPSGSGKSTALRLVAGLEGLDEGRIHLDGQDVTRTAPHLRRIAMVFQDLALYPHLTARENLAFGLKVTKVDDAEIERRVAEVARVLDLDPVLDRHPDAMSGGQQQRVALARAMIREPRVFLMDEPLSNLDPQLRAIAREEIHDLQRRLGTTTIYVTHDQSEAMTLGDRLAVLRDGRLEQLGTPQEIYDRPATTFVARFTGSPPMNLVPGGQVLGGTPDELVGVRPEDLEVVDAPTVTGAPTAAIAVTVTAVHALGSETVVTATTPDGDRLALRRPPREHHRPGDVLHVVAAADRLHRFDAATSARR